MLLAAAQPASTLAIATIEKVKKQNQVYINAVTTCACWTKKMHGSSYVLYVYKNWHRKTTFYKFKEISKIINY